MNVPNIYYLQLFIPEYTKLTQWINYNKKTPKQFPKDHSYLFNRSNFGHPNQALFRFQYNGKDPLTPPIKFIALDEQMNYICETEYRIEIKYPKVEVEISKADIKVVNGGFININVKICNDIIITIKDFDMKVFDEENDEEIPIIKHHLNQEQFMKLIDELPPEINPDHFLGKIEFPKDKKIKLQVQIQVFDLNNNEFWFKSNFISLKPEEVNKIDNLWPLNIPNIEQMLCAY